MITMINFKENVPDAIAALVLLTLVGYIGLGVIGFAGASLSSVSAVWMTLYATVVLMSAVKLYGKKTLEAVRNAGGKLVEMPGSREQ